MSDLMVDSIGVRPYDTLGYYNMPFLSNYAAVPNSLGYTPAATGNVSFEGGSALGQNGSIQNDKEPKKGNKRAVVVLSLLATAGAAVLCRKAYKIGQAKNVEGAWKCIKQGFSDMYKSVSKSVKNLFGKEDMKIASSTNGAPNPTTTPTVGAGGQNANPNAVVNDIKSFLNNKKEALKNVKAGTVNIEGKGGYHYTVEIKDGGELSKICRQQGKNGKIVTITDPEKLEQFQFNHFEQLYGNI